MKPYPPLGAVVVGVATAIAVSVLGDGLGWPAVIVAFLAAFLTMLVWWVVVDRPRGERG